MNSPEIARPLTLHALDEQIDPRASDSASHIQQGFRIRRSTVKSKNPYTPISFPSSIQIQYPHLPSYTYWDYEQAWFNTFLLQNPGYSHSWLFYFNTSIDTTNFPIWFSHWWDYFGRTPELLPEHPYVEEGYKFYKKAYQPLSSERRFRPITLFCAKFFLPWVCSWYYDYNFQDGSPILIRRFKVKW